MAIETLEHVSIVSAEPSELLSWTKICRKGWEDYLRIKHNGLTQHEELQLLQEFNSMRDVVRHLIPEEPVRVEDYAIVYEPSKMEENKIYSVELQGKLHLVRKINENTVETYELEPIE